VTGLDFPGEVMPTEETQQLYILPISFTATGDFCAVMAMASQVFKPFDKAFAKTCLAASLRAWDYLENNVGQGFENPEDVLTGEYGDGQDADERYWAAAVLYQVTGKEKYKDAFERYLNLFIYVLDGYGWSNVGGYANRIYLSMAPSKTDPECVQKIADGLAKKTETFVSNADQDGYGLSLGLSYPWGSNMTVCNIAMYLNDVSVIKGNDYSYIIDSHFHYLFGANPMSTCYVTGLGTASPRNPHHRPSMAVGSAMPGMLIGGPNSNLEDPYAKAVLAEAPPAKCYADNSQSYSCNEITVYWNSPLIYLMAQHMSE
jgi:endoglucanase